MLVSARAGSAARLLVFGTPPYLRLSLKLSSTSSNLVIAILVLSSSSIACRTSALVDGDALHKIATAVGGGVSVAKAQLGRL